MNLVIIKRNYFSKLQTTGVLKVFNEHGVCVYACMTLELPYVANVVEISCIPSGRYQAIKRNSPKFGDHFQILDVKKRNFILIHFGNFIEQSKGCILVGTSLSDIDIDGLLDIQSSKIAMATLNVFLSKDFNLIII